MKILSLNCQQGYNPALKDFLYRIFNAGSYDFVLLQEADGKVLSYLDHPSYRLVRSFNDETGKDSLLYIAYQAKYFPISTGFKSFAYARKDPVLGFKHPAYGLLWADFKIEEKIIRIASIHLHSGTDRQARLNELQVAKELLLGGAPSSVIFGGDFNAGFPSERTNMAQALLPEFMWATKDIGPTLNSRYTENWPHLPNRIAAFLSIFNMGIKLRTDHFFVDRESLKANTAHCSILPNRVSDHSPIELTVRD
jgi:endonuclease/exonuclease/phosphatase family metal-dependent hydrolase